MRTNISLLLAYGLLLCLFAAFLHRTSAHSSSRLATIYALVENGTFAIDHAPYETQDKVYIDGRYYSHQPPLQAVVGAVIYYPLRLLGLRLDRNESGPAYTLLTFALNGLSSLAAVVFFFLSLKRTSLPPTLRVPLTASLAFGTLLLPFGTTINSHSFVAALMAMGFYFFLLAREPGAVSSAAFWSGLALSFAAAADHTMLVFYGLFGLCLLARPGRRGQAIWFALPSLVALVPTALYYYVIGHSFKPFAARPELFVYPGSIWSANGNIEDRLTGASWNSFPFAMIYGSSLLVGPNGFLIYNPTACLALYGLLRTIRNRSKYWLEAVAVAAASAIVIGYYAFASVNYSGWSYSIRWFVPFLPLWWFFGPAAIEHWTKRKQQLVTVLCILSVFYALAGALNPWPPPYRGYLKPLVNIYRFWYPRHD